MKVTDLLLLYISPYLVQYTSHDGVRSSLLLLQGLHTKRGLQEDTRIDLTQLIH